MLTELQRLLRVWTTVWIVAGATTALGQNLPSTQAPIRFSREILPLLSDSCFACHGPDEKARKGGLRLDTLTGARGSGKSGQIAVNAGSPDQSEILRRILSSDPDEVMPPPESGKSLKPEQVALVRRWIEQGAPWGRHWAFEAPQRPAIPVVPGVSNPIDALVRSTLASDGLQPAPEAARSTLIRR